MSQPAIDWDADLQPDPEEEYDALLRALRRSEGFGLLFVQCAPAEGTRIIARVRADLPTRRVAVLSFDQPIADGNLFLQVQTRLTEQPADVLFIQGLEHSLLDYEDTKRSLGWTEQEIHSYSWKGVPPVMVNLNQQRENFRDQLHATLVFLVPPYVVKYLIHRAPDFFDWRSGIFEFPMDSERLQHSVSQIWSERTAWNEYTSLHPQERVQKISEIQALLDEQNQTSSQKADLLSEQATLLHANADYPAAIASYDKALKIKPDCYQTLFNKGTVLDDLKRYEEAINCYDQALQIKPDYGQALYAKGWVLDALGRYEEAIVYYDQALKIEPDKDVAWFNRGISLKNLGRYEEAIASYQKSLAFLPDDAWAYYNIARCYALMGEVERAVEMLERAIDLDEQYREEAKTDADFDGIREDERFGKVIGGMKDEG
ncbi:tetratricopeptide repeat protein [Thermoleptolyngbya sp.]